MNPGREERRSNAHLRTWIDELQHERDVLQRALLKLPTVMTELDPRRMLVGTVEILVDVTSADFGMFVPADRDREVIVTGVEVPELLPDVAEAPLLAAALDGAECVIIDDVERWAPSAASARPYGLLPGGVPVRSYLGAKIVDRDGDTLGALLVGHREPRRFDRHHETLVAGLANQLGVAIESALLFEERRETTRALQRTLLPPSFPEITGLDLGARYRATGTDPIVGGDFYDLFELDDDCWGLVVGDVSGVGPEAAAVTGLARYTVRAVARQDSDPAGVLAQLNEAIHNEATTERFCTAVYLRLAPGASGVGVVLASGGHPEALLLHADGRVEVLTEGRGMLLGLFPEAELTSAKFDLAPGDALVLYTDGVIEARDEDGEQFGDERLVELLTTCGGRTAEAIARRIELAAIDWQGGVSADDMAVVVVRVEPVG